ncbi:THAP domain-containing protein 11-like isoform X3 [Labrus mixtus]|uniref:THAP domain-containing protein 11-like isoform X3 n=1 Tax=Labrus mixtus TaxID=508554 RepID=UPI0029BFE22B|nr:THAP domain-containing protein 11-like isoform X3 [Labrus mixtus]
MVKSCCVLSCKNAFTKDSDLSFQRIPRDPEARRKWLSAIRRNNWNPGEDTWICGCHFVSGKRSYDPRHPDFVPSLFQYTTIAGRVQAVKNLKSYLQRKAVTKKNLLASTNREVAAMPDLSLQRVSASVIEAHNVQFQVIEIQTERAPADIAPLIERVESLNADVIKEEPHDGITSFHHQLQSLNTELTGEETHPDITSLHDQTEPLKGGIKTEEEHMDITSSHGHNPSLWAEVKPEDTSTELDSLHVQFESMQDEVKTENHVDVAPWCGQVEPLNAEVRTEETNGDVASLHERIRSLNAECQSLRDKVHRLESEHERNQADSLDAVPDESGNEEEGVEDSADEACQGKKKKKRGNPEKWRVNIEKKRRMRGQSSRGRKNQEQVLKEERKMGKPCQSAACQRSKRMHCREVDELKREEIFKYFWDKLDWKERKVFGKSLVEVSGVKRRRTEADISRRSASNFCHLVLDGRRLSVPAYVPVNPRHNAVDFFEMVRKKRGKS